MIKKNLSSFFILLTYFGYAQSLNVGIDLFDLGEFEKSKVFFLTISEENSERNYYLGRIAFEDDELDDAVDFFEDAIDQKELSKYYTWLGNSLGIKAQNSNFLTQGILAPQIKSAYEMAVSIDAKNIVAQWGLVQYYSQAPGFMGGSWEKAEETALAIGKINELEGCDAMITVYAAQEKYDMVEEQHIKASEIDKMRLVNLGIFYQSRKRFNEAFETFENAHLNDSTDYNSLYQIGRTSALVGTRFERGIQCLTDYLNEKHHEGTPSHAGAYMRLGMIYEKQGNKAKAIESYQQSIKQDPEMDLAIQGLQRLK